MSEIQYLAEFIDTPAIGRGLKILEDHQDGKKAQNAFCSRLLGYIKKNNLNPRHIGKVITENDFYAGYRVLPSYEDEVVGTVNIVFHVRRDTIIIYMIQMATRRSR